MNLYEDNSARSRGDGSSVQAESNGVAESETVVCHECSSANSVGDTYCTACGNALASAPAEVRALGRTPAAGARERAPTATVRPGESLWSGPEKPLSKARQPKAEPDRRASRRWPLLLVTAIAIAMLAGTSTFALLWRSQTQHLHRVQAHLVRVQDSLARTQDNLAVTGATLAKTKAALSAMSAVAEKRRTVLLRTREVLTKVDPLLSSVDEIQKESGDVQSASDTLSTDADHLVSSLATATNYLANTDPAYVDIAYYNSLIDDANNYFYSLQSDEASLTSSESSYQDASSKFGTHADAFSVAVRNLQRQLKRVSDA
jgi:hypothetical protein